MKEQIINFIHQFLKNKLSGNVSKINKELSFKLAQELVKNFEGLRFKAYKCSAGIWTIGWGNTNFLKGKANPAGCTITLEKAQELFEQDLSHFFNFICDKCGIICNERQIASLTSFAFNVGLAAFAKSTLLKVILQNANDKENIAQQFARWNKVAKNVSGGLSRRREIECDFYFS